jgi:anti-sigma factor RsiW
VIACEQFRQHLYGFLAGELSERRRADSEAHLHTCTSCAAEFWTYCMTVELARSLAPLPTPPGLLRRLRVACDGTNSGMTDMDVT